MLAGILYKQSLTIRTVARMANENLLSVAKTIHRNGEIKPYRLFSSCISSGVLERTSQSPRFKIL